MNLKKYNQVILAAAGTLVFLFLLGAGIVAIYEMRPYSPSYETEVHETGIISTEVTDSLVTEHQVRRQIITLSEFQLLDSASATYMLPVQHSNLGEDEYLDTGLLNLMSGSGSREKVRKNYRGVSYNNLLLFEPHLANPKMLFTEKVSIDNYLFLSHDNEDFLFIRAVDKDTNEDGYLNGYDIQRLWLYNISQQKFIPVAAPPHANYLNFAKRVNKTELILQYGEDRDENGEFEPRQEPKMYYKLNIDTGELELLVSPAMLEDLQGILDGSAE